jgi:hypothetical protein
MSSEGKHEPTHPREGEHEPNHQQKKKKQIVTA